ncbi:dehydrogenase/reductase SDR family member 7-like isoform X2 [Zootermopsis nevadensis]|uniref:dehydrogenase/reductase SDR family member 7-like isoform X2 n=1 Tax=Zootermopsis nevadensis TaxID=136037 RepID=UPI000B8EB7BA|nr:dehydrogenase/reductase SDR family member 7-like isoform X2 [Zootermopsis nevadensis]
MGVCTFIVVAAVVFIVLYIITLLLVDCDLGLAFATKVGKKIDTLNGKVVWITGASSGIGEHIALALARGGAKLILSARRLNELQRVKESCLATGKNLTDEDILVLQMDVTAVDKLEFHFQKVIEHFGKLDILVNNAGRSQRANWEEIELDVDRQMFDLNVFAVVALSRIAVRYFQKKKEGHIVVTSSLAGVKAVPFSGSYTGAKYAIHGYFDALRTEKMASNITVTLLCPGPVFSNFLAESFTEKTGEKFGKSVEATDRRMTGERCGYLCAVAIANKLGEAWMALSPIIPFYYISVYYPNIRYLPNRGLASSYVGGFYVF